MRVPEYDVQKLQGSVLQHEGTLRTFLLCERDQ